MLLEPIATVPPVGLETALTCRLSPSGSVSFAAGLPGPETGSVSTVLTTPVKTSSCATGGRFAQGMLSVTRPLSVPPFPSETVYVNAAAPFPQRSCAGVNLISPDAIPTDPPVGLETALTNSLSPSGSVSLAAGLPAPASGSSFTVFSTAEKVSSAAVGGWFAAQRRLIVSRADDRPPWPSPTV